jgi:hypothetical protein
LSFILYSFSPSASIVATYIFTDPTSTIIIIIFESYALNVEFDHFIPRFNKNYFVDTTERGDRGLKQRRKVVKQRVTFRIILLGKWRKEERGGEGQNKGTVMRVENYLGISDGDIAYGTSAIEAWWWEKPQKES